MKTYRKRFVQLNLLLVGVVLLLSLVGLGIYLYVNARQELRQTMEAVVSPLNGVASLREDGEGLWNGMTPPEGELPPDGENPWNGETPPDGENPRNGEKPPDGEMPPDGRREDGERQQKAGDDLRSINTIFRDRTSGELQLLGETALVDESVLEALTARINAEQADFGELQDYGLFYYRSAQQDRIAIAPLGYVWDAVKGPYLILGIVFVAAMGLFWLISRRISKLAVRPLEESMRREKQFVADASHDLKTPLTVMLANLSILKAHPDEPVGTQRQWIESSEQAAHRMQGLVNEMLTLSQADAAPEQRPKQTVDLSSLVTKAALQMESLAFEREITLETEIEDGISVQGWPDALSRVTEALIENAMKYEPVGGKIRVRLEQKRRSAVLSVQNPGGVINPEDLPHVFERFYRADKTRSSQGGHGLGLAIVKRLCESMGGDVTAESSPEDGTTFRVTLPHG